jgi:choice-of-anchor C domain-containing protein
MKRTNLAIAAAVLLSSPLAFSANIIDAFYGVGAGSFEIPGHTGPLFVTVNTSSSDLTGWTVNTTSVDWAKSTVWNPSEGNYSIDLNGTPGGPGGLQTVIPTTAGTTYKVTFDIAAYTAPGSTTNPKTFETTAAGVTTQFSLSTSDNYGLPFNLPLNVTWTSRSFEFVAVDVMSTVSFVSTVASEPAGVLLDNVAIVAVPEPGSTGKLAPQKAQVRIGRGDCRS